jgi:hypothetical protein
MAHTFTLLAPRDAVSIRAPRRARPAFAVRLMQAIFESRQRRAEREIERYIASCGFTDAIEREIERRYLADPSIPL